MDRRLFIKTASGNFGVAYLSLCGCSSVAAADSIRYRLRPTEHRVERLTSDGAVRGTFDPCRRFGQWNNPIAGAVGPDGRLYVVDRGNDRIVSFFDDGTCAGVIGGRGRGDDALRHPSDLAFGGDALYVADTLHHRVVVFDRRGAAHRSIGSFGFDDAHLNGPRGVAVAPDGHLHVLDAGNCRVQVFRANGSFAFGYGGYGPSPGRLTHPTSIVADRRGRISIADPAAGVVHVFDATGRFQGRLVRTSG